VTEALAVYVQHGAPAAKSVNSSSLITHSLTPKKLQEVQWLWLINKITLDCYLPLY